MQANEESAYVEYVAGRQRWLRGLAFRLCGDWHRADDLAQQVWIRLYLHWARASRASSLDGYVRRMALNAWLAEQRGGWLRRVRPVAAVPDRAAHGGDPGTGLDLLAALDRLTAGQRAVIVLRFWDGLSVADTASLLCCSEGTVKSQTARSIAALRRLMPEYASPHRPEEDT
jgi:RNA polymerase sigma-70 factor (sigma-E family)